MSYRDAAPVADTLPPRPSLILRMTPEADGYFRMSKRGIRNHALDFCPLWNSLDHVREMLANVERMSTGR